MNRKAIWDGDNLAPTELDSDSSSSNKSEIPPYLGHSLV